MKSSTSLSGHGNTDARKTALTGAFERAHDLQYSRERRRNAGVFVLASPCNVCSVGISVGAMYSSFKSFLHTSHAAASSASIWAGTGAINAGQNVRTTCAAAHLTTKEDEDER